MKALVKAKAEPGIWLREIPVPEVGPDDVRIRVMRTSICGTDVHIYDWDEWAQKTVPVPMTVGHEFSGVIDAVGENVDRLQIGQRVSGEGHIIGRRSRNVRADDFIWTPTPAALVSIVRAHLPNTWSFQLLTSSLSQMISRWKSARFSILWVMRFTASFLLMSSARTC